MNSKSTKKNKKRNFYFIVIVFLIGTMYGLIMHELELFPYKQLRNTFHNVKGTPRLADAPASKEQSTFYDLWSIGIYEGLNPFELSSSPSITNPIISANDVTDINTSYVADPFMIVKNETYYVFFEAFNWDSQQGDIALAISNDGVNWEYDQVVIDEPFHLSYPYVFEYNNEYYMIPESNEDLSVRLYKANNFPENWEYVGNLISGYHYIDPSLVHYNNKWWLFVAAVPDDGVVNLYYSDELLGEWKTHPMNPIVKLDKHFGRPGGRMLVYNDKLYRLAQDSFIEYGMQVFAFEIIELNDKLYKEKIVSESPMVTRSGIGWNAAGMHHVDLHYLGEKWIAVADGKKFSELKNLAEPPKVH